MSANAEVIPYEPNARDESYHCLLQVLDVLGYPREWAAALEQRCFESGRVWRSDAPPVPTKV